MGMSTMRSNVSTRMIKDDCIKENKKELHYFNE